MNYQHRAIDIISNREVLASRMDKMISYIAKHHPSVLVKAYESTENPVQEPTWMKKVRDLANAGMKIHAIKEYRAQTGEGLAEANAIVEKMM